MNTVRTYLDQILELNTHFFVDIGASDCPGESQSESLLENGWSGVMFECDPVKYAGLSRRMKGKPVQIIPDKVTVDNILDHLKSANVPNDFYLSIDIDGYDYFVLRKILSTYKPQLIVSEINEKIPPPIQFTVMYDPEYWWKGWHHFGYSLSMLENVLDEFGYKVHELDFNNVLLVPGKQEEPLSKVYYDGYLGKPDKDTRFYYNTDFGPIYRLPVNEQIDFINKKFKDYQGQYTINGKFYIENSGEIKCDSPFGKYITQYASDPRFTRYVEIGTSTGNGSTCCFYEGFHTRTDGPQLQSYEIAKQRADIAKRYWKLVDSIRVHYGRVLETSRCPIYYESAKRFAEINLEWYKEDITNFWNAPHVPVQNPQVVLLDGSEYITDTEFMEFEKETSIQVFLLNCIRTNKCAYAYQTLSASPDWVCVETGDDGNGWAIFERVTASSEQTPENRDDQ